MEGWENRCFLHFKCISNYQSVLQRGNIRHIHFNYFRKSMESARKRPTLDDFNNTIEFMTYSEEMDVYFIKNIIEIGMSEC